MKNRILATVLTVGLLFSGIAVQAAEARSCSHNYGVKTKTTVTNAYTHTYVATGGVTKTCDVTSGTELHQIVCSLCGDVQQTWTTSFSDRHSTNHN